MRIYDIARTTRAKNDRGDTIVEVLISTAIISMVLVGAFTIANRNRLASQQVQEYSNAQKLLESQTEKFKSMSIDDVTAGCNGPDGACAPETIGGATYDKKITKINDTTYKVDVSWDTLGGSRATASIYYTIPPENFALTQLPVPPPVDPPTDLPTDPPTEPQWPPICNVKSGAIKADPRDCRQDCSDTQTKFPSDIKTTQFTSSIVAPCDIWKNL